jgi:hypothetical protein
MSAEQLIALEAAQAELGTLYAVARTFAALQTRAETELLPHLMSLGGRLRRLLRTQRLTDDEIEASAREILALRTTWQTELQAVRASAIYQQALSAFAADRQDDLAALIPQVFAGVRRLHPAPSLYFSVSPSSGRRRPGTSPFLSAAECADRILRVLEGGCAPETSGTQWWDCEVPSISCADSAATLESPIALHLAASEVHVAVFAAGDTASLRVFTPRLRAPMSIVLATEATDEWWEAYQDSYQEFRAALRQELLTRGYGGSIGSM